MNYKEYVLFSMLNKNIQDSLTEVLDTAEIVHRWMLENYSEEPTPKQILEWTKEVLYNRSYEPIEPYKLD